MEHDLDQFVAESEKDSLLNVLPLSKIWQRFARWERPRWCGFKGETESDGLELLVPVKIAFEMLKENHLLA